MSAADDSQVPAAPLTSADSVRDVGWIAREAAALVGSDDEQRRARFLLRKRALLDYIEAPADEAEDDGPELGGGASL